MHEQRQGMLAIGAFAAMTQLSLKALRLYDQLAILRPKDVDPVSGYRYYSLNQVPTARLIRLMREVGMPLASIRQALSAAPDEAEALVQAHLRRMERRLIEARTVVNHLLSTLRKEQSAMSIEINVLDVPAQPMISINRRVTIEQLTEHITGGLAQLEALAQQRGVASVGLPFGIYHGQVNEQDDGPIEVCLPIAHEVAGEGEIKSSTLPSVRAASVTLHGLDCQFPAILKGYDALVDWINANGYALAGSPREHWGSPGSENTPDDLMQIVWPFSERG
jgi:DNA-binding transcriptional MerR regulator